MERRAAYIAPTTLPATGQPSQDETVPREPAVAVLHPWETGVLDIANCRAHRVRRGLEGRRNRRHAHGNLASRGAGVHRSSCELLGRGEQTDAQCARDHGGSAEIWRHPVLRPDPALQPEGVTPCFWTPTRTPARPSRATTSRKQRQEGETDVSQPNISATPSDKHCRRFEVRRSDGTSAKRLRRHFLDILLGEHG